MQSFKIPKSTYISYLTIWKEHLCDFDKVLTNKNKSKRNSESISVGAINYRLLSLSIPIITGREKNKSIILTVQNRALLMVPTCCIKICLEVGDTKSNFLTVVVTILKIFSISWQGNQRFYRILKPPFWLCFHVYI